MKKIDYDLIGMALATFDYLGEKVKFLPLESISRINVCIEDELELTDASYNAEETKNG